MFMDETAFWAGEGGQKRCVRAAGEAHLPQHINRVFRRGSTLHIWRAIYYGIKLPPYRFELTKARTINGRKVAAQAISGDVYMRQILAGPLKD